MAIRFAATSALALAAALFVAPAAHAQGFFSFFEMSPRQIVGMLEDDGYRLRAPMLRRGDVYVCDVVSITGRPARLIVDARDGRVVERFASTPRRRHFADGPGGLHPPRDIGDDGSPGDADATGRRTAMGGDYNATSRAYGSDGLFGARPAPTANPEPKPKHHAIRKHKEPAVAKDSGAKDSGAAPGASADAKANDKPSDDASSVAAVAPGGEPAKPDAAPKPAPSPDREQAKVDSDKRAVAEPAPKAEAPRKKLNDLPVGTLD